MLGKLRVLEGDVSTLISYNEEMSATIVSYKGNVLAQLWVKKKM